MNKDQFAARLRAARAFRGVTQEQVADACGMLQGNYAKYERGLVMPSIETVARFEAALGLPASSLLSDRLLTDLCQSENTAA